MTPLALKSLHIIFMVAWFSGLFFLVRMMIYQVEATQQGASPDVLALLVAAQRRVRHIIIGPSVIGTIGFGTGLAWQTGAFSMPWLHFKLGLVALLLVYQAWAWRLSAMLPTCASTQSSRRLRLMNEVPFFILVGVVFAAVFRDATSGIKALVGLIGLVGSVGLIVRLIKQVRSS